MNIIYKYNKSGDITERLEENSIAQSITYYNSKHMLTLTDFESHKYYKKVVKILLSIIENQIDLFKSFIESKKCRGIFE